VRTLDQGRDLPTLHLTGTNSAAYIQLSRKKLRHRENQFLKLIRAWPIEFSTFPHIA
jgi:hypothetical protein